MEKKKNPLNTSNTCPAVGPTYQCLLFSCFLSFLLVRLLAAWSRASDLFQVVSKLSTLCHIIHSDVQTFKGNWKWATGSGPQQAGVC